MLKQGYIRVSTDEQNLDRQIDGLTPICDNLHIEKISAKASIRPVFECLLNSLKPGDTLVVWDLDRAFRSTVDAINTADNLQRRGINFQIVSLGVDTSTADGKLIYTIIAALAEHERNRLSERTKQGLESARKRGKVLGRPVKLSETQIRIAKRRIETDQASLSKLANQYGVHASTIARSIARLHSFDDHL